MAEPERVAKPTLEQFAEAAEVNYTRTPYQRALDSPERFRGFQKLGVELGCVRRLGRLEAVAYLLPGCEATAENTGAWVYLFQVAARTEAPGAGSLLIRQVMQWYPAILGIGITPDAVRIYRAFKWTHFADLWRYVHPLHLDRMLEDYGERLSQGWQRRCLRASAGVYNLAAGLVERALAAGKRCEPWEPDAANVKARGVADYYRLYRCGGVKAADVGGAGRIGNAAADGLGSLREHAAVWRELRGQRAKFCEMLIPSPEWRGRALRLGYWPVRLPVWYWDRKRTMGPVLEALKSGRISFLETDKVV